MQGRKKENQAVPQSRTSSLPSASFRLAVERSRPNRSRFPSGLARANLRTPTSNRTSRFRGMSPVEESPNGGGGAPSSTDSPSAFILTYHRTVRYPTEGTVSGSPPTCCFNGSSGARSPGTGTNSVLFWKLHPGRDSLLGLQESHRSENKLVSFFPTLLLSSRGGSGVLPPGTVVARGGLLLL